MSTATAEIRVRAAEKKDWTFVRELCCRTGDAGQAIEKKRWKFFAEAWVGPYQKLVPNWTLIAEASGAPAGYLTGCADTTHFMRLRRVLFQLPLLFQALSGRYPHNADTRRFIRRAFRMEKSPEQRFSRKIRKLLRQKYPAHLHMNVEAEFRKAGVGHLLFERFRDELRRERVTGIHVFCGEAPLGFYLKQGFKEIAQVENSKGIKVYALGYEN